MQTKTSVVTRFAPSPTGRLHLGHIYSALMARQYADAHGGEMRLRIDDIDHTRCRDEFTQAIYDDLDFMGITFDGEVKFQSQRKAIYQAALDDLKSRGLIYPCFLTRRELDALLSAPHHDAQPPRNTDDLITHEDATMRADRGDQPAWRLRMEAIKPIAQGLSYTEDGEEPITVDLDAIGDDIMARRDIGTSYHLSVVLDDCDGGITHVTRGEDLKPSTPLHRLLYHLLDLAPPIWQHHSLITDRNGQRLAKRDDAIAISTLRAEGLKRDDILALLNQ